MKEKCTKKMKANRADKFLQEKCLQMDDENTVST